MSKKRKRRGSRDRQPQSWRTAGPTPAGTAGVGPDPGAGEETAAPAPTEARADGEGAVRGWASGRRRGAISQSLRAPSPYPPLRQTMGTAVAMVAERPVLLAVPLVSAAVLWLALVPFGIVTAPRRYVELYALPPIGTFFDVGTGAGMYGLSSLALVAAGGLAVLRAVLTAVLIGLALEGIDDGTLSFVGVLRGIRAMPTVAAIGLLHVFVILFLNTVIPPLLGVGIGGLIATAGFGASMYFLVFAPVAAVRSGLGFRESLRRSIRAALLPGSRHVWMVLVYFVVALFIPLVSPGPRVTAANPPFALWVVVFAATLLHACFLIGFSYRYAAVEAEIPPPQPRERRRPAPARGRRR